MTGTVDGSYCWTEPNLIINLLQNLIYEVGIGQVSRSLLDFSEVELQLSPLLLLHFLLYTWLHMGVHVIFSSTYPTSVSCIVSAVRLISCSLRATVCIAAALFLDSVCSYHQMCICILSPSEWRLRRASSLGYCQI